MPYDERDDDTGRFRPTFSDEQFIDTVSERDLPTTREIADALGCNYRTAYDRLKSLESEGRVRSRSIGGSLAWFGTEADS